MPTLRRSAALAAPPVPRRFLRRILAHLDLARSRRALLQLDDRLLRDIGLTRSEAEAEAAQSSWDAPLHWRG